MNSIKYKMLKTLSSHPDWSFHIVFCKKRNRKLFMKKATTNHTAALKKLHYEKNILANTDRHYLLQPIDIEEYQTTYSLLYDYFDATTLDDYAKNKLSLSQFKKVSLSLTNAFISLEQQHLLYQGIHSSSILINPKNHAISLIATDSLVSIYDKNSPTYHSTSYPIEFMNYFSPEQTGQTNQTIDYRSDLYSLGVLFYEMLTKEMPFQQTSQRELIYDILTKKPQRLHALRPELPLMLGEILNKLLQKDKKDRYQSAQGLKNDLETLFKNIEQGIETKMFPLGSNDTGFTTNLDQQLIGRQAEINELHKVLHKTINGKKQLLVVEGKAGVGKSAFINELQWKTIASNGYFVTTKISKSKYVTEHSLVVSSIRQLLKQIYTETNQLIQWKIRFKQTDLTVTSILVETIPEIGWFLDDLPPINHAINTRKNRNVFYSDLAKILQIFSIEKYPIILFFDDIHWSSTSSINDLIDFYKSFELSHICFIFSYRLEETFNKMNLQSNLGDLPNLTFIELTSLNKEEIFEWVTRSIQMEEKSYTPLVNQLTTLAKGNPYHTKNLFLSMIQSHTLHYSSVNELWVFDSKKMNLLELPSNILELLTIQIKQLPKDMQYSLNIASYFGQIFNLNELLYVSNLSFENIYLQLKNLIQKGYLIPLNNNFKYAQILNELNLLHTEEITFQFVHDHILHTAQNLTPDSEQSPWHYKIGAYYYTMKNMDSLDILEKTTMHWNLCQDTLSDSEKNLLLKWNFILSKKASNAGLFHLSFQHIIECFKLLSDNHWQTTRELSFEIFVLRGTVEGLLYDVEDAMLYLDEAFDKATTLEQKLHIYFVKTRIYLDRDDVKKSIQVGIEALNMASLKIPIKPTNLQLAQAYFKTKFKLAKKDTNKLLNSPDNEDPVIHILLEIMIELVSAGFLINKKLATFLILKSVRMILTYGKTDSNSIIWNNYSLILIAGFDQFNEGVKYNNLSLVELAKTTDLKSLANIHLTIGSFINHWEKPFDTNIQHLRKSQKYAKELSINHMLAGSSSLISAILFTIGCPLGVVKQEILDQQQFLQATPMSLSTNYLAELDYWIDSLQHPQQPIDWAQDHLILSEETISYMHYSLRQLASFLYKNEEQLVHYLIACHQVEKDISILPVMPHTLFIQSLSLYSILQRQSNALVNKPIKIKAVLKKNLQRLKSWSDLQQANFGHMYNLLRAEQLRAENTSKDPLLYYDRAIQLSRQHHHLQDEAICCERAANYCVSKNYTEAAQSYLAQAISALEQWEAHHIIVIWKKAYHSLFEKMNHINKGYIASSDLPIIEEITSLTSENIDIASNLRSSLLIMMKKLGATSCSWFNYDEGDIDFIATIQRNSEFICVDYVHPESPSIQYDQNSLRFVFTSKESLMINNVAQKTTTTQHLKNKLSIYYLPIIYNEQVATILYFENDQSSNTFNESSAQFLKIIATQLINLLAQVKTVVNLEAIVDKRTTSLTKLNSELLASNQQMEFAKHNQQNLFQHISHDLRSPLTSVIGFIDLLVDGVIDDPVKIDQYLLRSREKLFTMNQMIQDLFDLSKLEVGTLQLDFEIWSAQKLFFDLNNRLLFDVNQTHLDYFSEMKVDEELLLSIDIKRIEQVLMNLIQNAVKHTTEGSIHFSMVKRAAYVDFIIRDTGSGIDPQHIPFIFDVNFTKSTGISSDSSGIGLAICKQIIENHNGQFFVDSTINKGSSFIFSIPFFIQ